MLEKTEETGRTFPLKKYIDYELKAIIMVLAVFWLHAFFCVEVLQTWGTLLHKRYFEELYLLSGVSHQSVELHFGQEGSEERNS